MMKACALLMWVVFFNMTLVQAQELKSCGKVIELLGTDCQTIKVKMDISSCEDTKESVSPAISSCKNNQATSIYRSRNYTYRAVFRLNEGNWGKAQWTLDGSVWQGRRKASEAAKKSAPENEVPLASVEAPQPSMVQNDSLAKVISAFSGITLKGSLDFYYGYNFNNPEPLTGVPTAANARAQNKYRVFDVYHEDMQLSYAHLMLKKQEGPVGVVWDFAYGPAMQTVSGTATDANQINVKQAILSYKTESGFLFEVGRFVTHLGLEVIESQDNWNYSRSLMFGYFIPFWHQGLKLTYTPNENLSFMIMGANGWNNSYDTNRNKAFGAQLAWTPTQDMSLMLNSLSANEAPLNTQEEWRDVIDFIWTFRLSERWSFAFNSENYTRKRQESATANGNALYVKYNFNDRWSIAPRFEVVDDKDNVVFGENFSSGQKVTSYTLTLENKLTDHFIWRLEARTEKSSEKPFMKNGEAQDSQTTGALAFIGAF